MDDLDIHRQQIMSAPDLPDENRCLRPYDKALTTRKTCHVGLMLSYILAFSGLVATVTLATALAKAEDDLTLINSTGVIGTGSVGQAAFFMIPLVLATIVTFCSESLGLVHTTSLRWALWREGRLHFNTNLRLMTQAHSSKPNRWAVNLYAIFVTALTYAAAGQIFFTNLYTMASHPEKLNLSFSVPALAAMTFGLFSQAAIATWSFLVMRHHVPTWSTNPLNVALACKYQGLKSRPNRTLVSYHKIRDKSNASFQHPIPHRRQPSLAASRLSAVRVTVLLWAVVLAALIWASCTLGIGQQSQDVSQGAGTSALHRGKVIIWTSSWSSSTQLRWTVVLFGIAFTFATQLIFTFALHCTELLVNATRDERVWRKASDHLKAKVSTGAQYKRKMKTKGAAIDSNAIKEACTAWETVTLFMFKTAIHWAFGESVQVRFDEDGNTNIVIWANALVLLLVFLFGIAVFGTYLCCRRPSGPQPVAYGHTQTLVDLIDDWGKEDELLYWGDKGHVARDKDGEIRRAGTAGRSEGVGWIRMDARYG